MKPHDTMMGSALFALTAATILMASDILPGAASALADVTLFEAGGWRVDGVADTILGPGAFGSITVSTNGAALGQFTELKIYFDLGTNGVPQVFDVQGTGALRPSLPPPGVFGGSFYTTAYWDCSNGFVAPMGFVALDLSLDHKKPNGLRLTGQASNFTSFEANDFSLLVRVPKSDSVKAEVSYRLTATRDFCVDKTHQRDLDDGFQLAAMLANYLSPDTHDNDIARYVGVKDKICLDPYDFDNCFTVTKTFCADLANTNGFLFSNPHRVARSKLFLLHRDASPSATPNLILDIKQPSSQRFRAQGAVTTTDNANTDNVAFWANWIDAKNSYKQGKRTPRFRFSIEAAPPDPKDCH